MVDETDLEWTEHEGEHTAYRRKKLAAAAGGEQVGASMYELDPGERSWPLHYHTGNEEAIYVLSGTGTLRRGEGYDDLALAPGEYVACLADESGAHQVVNDSEERNSSGSRTQSDDGEEVLRYLMVLTMHEPDVAVYPEHDGVGVFAGAPPGGEGERTVSGFWNRGDAVDYWD